MVHTGIIAVTCRFPVVGCRAMYITKSTVSAITVRSIFSCRGACGFSAQSCSRRFSAGLRPCVFWSSAASAWIVQTPPGCPVFQLFINSQASPPRTSPMNIRSGRCRNADRSSSTIVVSAVARQITFIHMYFYIFLPFYIFLVHFYILLLIMSVFYCC